jgi:hypothetical protein
MGSPDASDHMSLDGRRVNPHRGSEFDPVVALSPVPRTPSPKQTTPLSRWLHNSRINVHRLYKPLIQAALARLARGRDLPELRHLHMFGTSIVWCDWRWFIGDERCRWSGECSNGRVHRCRFGVSRDALPSGRPLTSGGQGRACWPTEGLFTPTVCER